MQRISFLALTASIAASFCSVAGADTTADLIALDKQWGAAGVKGDAVAAGKLLADSLVAVDGTGITDKKGELAGTTAAPAGTSYESTDYKVTFLDADTAIMTHASKGYQAHYSLHVWSHKSGQWQVVATSSTPVTSK